MKCPKCNYIGFDDLSTCKKCGRDLTKVREKLNIPFSRSLSVEDSPIHEDEPSLEIESVVATLPDESYEEGMIPEAEIAEDTEEVPLELEDAEIGDVEEDIIIIDEGALELTLDEDKGMDNLMMEVVEESVEDTEESDENIIEITDIEIEDIELVEEEGPNKE
ncbi:MAG: hypothetical protein SVW57_09165 [Thermodesulfobacteriota bacterium]|nr:hypothetical protein [Thermodesulfobacteriota bacterium]